MMTLIKESDMDDEDLIDTLNELIETCRDGDYGFRACAAQVKSAALATLLIRRADNYGRLAEELQRRVVILGGTPNTAGSAAAALHRGWVALRSSLSVFDDGGLLKECERGEDVAARTYRRALEKSLPAPIRLLLEDQFLGVKRSFEQVCDLRNSEQVKAFQP